MNIYKISQTKNTDYDTYNSAIVVAETEDEARHIHPNKYGYEIGWWELYEEYDDYYLEGTVWCHPKDVQVEVIGTTLTHEKGVILASFNAG